MFYYIFIVLFLLFCYYLYNKNKLQKKIIVSIEGNIGAGKSTLLSIIKEYMKNDVYFVPEPVDIWLSITDNDESILSKFYKDPSRWAYTFQNLAFITRIESIKKGLKSNKKIILSERSVFTDKKFI